MAQVRFADQFAHLLHRVDPDAEFLDLTTMWLPANEDPKRLEHLFTFGRPARLPSHPLHPAAEYDDDRTPAKIAKWSIPITVLIAALDGELALPFGAPLRLMPGTVDPEPVERTDRPDPTSAPWRTHMVRFKEARDGDVIDVVQGSRLVPREQPPNAIRDETRGKRPHYPQARDLIPNVMRYPRSWNWGIAGCLGMILLVEDRRGRAASVNLVGGELVVMTESATGDVPAAVRWMGNTGFDLTQDPPQGHRWVGELGKSGKQGKLTIVAKGGDVCEIARLDLRAAKPVESSRTEEAPTTPYTLTADPGEDLPHKHFEFRQHIKSGGYAGVWRAFDPQLGREVAVKVFPFTESAWPGALDHARALAKVDHPHVVTVHEVVRVTDPSGSGHIVEAMVMRLIAGADLEERLNGDLFPLDIVRQVGCDVLDGLGAFHEQGFFHGDLNDGNVMIDEHWRGHVIDAFTRGTPMAMASSQRSRSLVVDVDAARQILALLLNHSDADAKAIGEFNRKARKASNLDALRVALEAALERPSSSTPARPTSDRWLTASTATARLRRRILSDVYDCFMDSPTAWSGWRKGEVEDILSVVHEARWLEDHEYIDAEFGGDGSSVSARITTAGRDLVETHGINVAENRSARPEAPGDTAPVTGPEQPVPASWELDAAAQAFHTRTGPPKLSPREVKRPSPAPGPIFPQGWSGDALGRTLQDAVAVMSRFNTLFGGRFASPSDPFGRTAGLTAGERWGVRVKADGDAIELVIDGKVHGRVAPGTKMDGYLGPLLVDWAKKHDLHGQ